MINEDIFCKIAEFIDSNETLLSLSLTCKDANELCKHYVIMNYNNLHKLLTNCKLHNQYDILRIIYLTKRDYINSMEFTTQIINYKRLTQDVIYFILEFFLYAGDNEYINNICAMYYYWFLKNKINPQIIQERIYWNVCNSDEFINKIYKKALNMYINAYENITNV